MDRFSVKMLLRSIKGSLGRYLAIVAIIAIPCFQLWKRSGITLSTVWIPVGVAIAVGLLGVSPTFIVVALAVLGLLYGVLVRGGE